MTKNLPDERLVYLALKNTFKGTEAQVRRAKKVRELILKRQHNDDIKNLIREHNLDDVCNVAKALLEQQIFESTLKAKIRFPEVFEVSPAQSAERTASEAEAAKTEVNAIRVAAEGHKSGETSELGQGVNVAVDEVQPPSLHESTAQSRKRTIPHATIDIPSLYPVYLPFQTQHQLLVKVQGILERACYDFGVRTMTQIMECEGWDCAEAVELNRWSRVLLSQQDKFPQADLEALGKSFSQILDSIAHLRHTAVHRLRISANLLEQFMIDAEALARLVRDDCSLQKLTRLRMDTQLTIGELKRNKDLLESKLSSKLRNIASQRARLDHLEQIAVKEMLLEDKEYQVLAGANLEQVINTPDTTIPSEAPTELEVKSEADVEADLGPDLSSDLDPDLDPDLVPVTSSDQDA